MINGLEDPDRLAKVGDLVVDCATGRELLDRTGRIPSLLSIFNAKLGAS